MHSNLICFCFSGMQTAEAELLYIKEVEKLDGFGQESFPAKVGPSQFPCKTPRNSCTC